jgi:C1A family cysteine protease
MVSKLIRSLCTILLLAGSAVAASLVPASPGPELSPGGRHFQVAPLNPDFVAWRARQQAGAIRVFAPTGTPSGIVPSPFDDSYLRREKLAAPLSLAVPSRYDLRTLGWVTPARNQGVCGSCFAFATYSSLESWLLKNAKETWDFSENHLKNYSGIDLSPCLGGDSLTSTAYLVRWAGPVAEVNDPFHDWDDRPSPGGPVRKYVTSALRFYSRADIKNAILNYGALFAPMYWPEDYTAYYDAATNAYHYAGTPEVNHAIGVIGWDDSKAVPGAPKKGAWLVKSSWGTDFGEQGCFYVSYENHSDVPYGMAYCDAVPTSTYLRNYQYDPLGFTGTSVGAGDSTCWGANVFTAVANEALAAVGFYALAENTAYTITICGMIERQEELAVFGAPLVSISGTARYFGYHTIPLPSRVTLRRGQEFAIVVQFTTPGTDLPVPLEVPVEGYSSKATANAREGYLSVEGELFIDVTSQEGCEQASVCIKGLTAPCAGSMPPTSQN